MKNELKGDSEREYAITIEQQNGSSPASQELFVFPTTYVQQQLWFLFDMDRQNVAYNIPFAFRLRGTICKDSLEKSVNEIVRRHANFRTTFRFFQGKLMQGVVPQMAIPMPITDLSNLAEEQKNREVEILNKKFAQTPFNLETDPLFRTGLIKLNVDDHIFLLNMHHIIIDHQSIHHFNQELCVLYKAFKNNQPTPLTEPALQFADYAVWQEKTFGGKQSKATLDYWKEALSDCNDFLGLPTDRPRPKIQLHTGMEQKIHIPKPLSEKFKQFSRREGVPLYITLLSAINVIFHKYTGLDHITIGSPFSNRNEGEMDEVMGCFVNTLPISTDLSGNPSFCELNSRVRKTFLGAQKHQAIPFEIIVDEIQPKRDLSFNPIFQVLFTFQAPPMELDLQGLNSKSYELHNGASKFDMSVWFWDADDGIRGLLEFDTQLFDYSTWSRFVEHYKKLIQSIVENPNTPIRSLEILPDQEKKQILNEWNSTQETYDLNLPIHQLFENQVKKTPDDVALIAGNDKMTYSQLEWKSNQLARHLRSIGVGSEVLVGIITERNFNMFIGILGILKAGGAYLPLDPSFPKDRLEVVVKDANAQFFVSQSALIERLPENDGKIILTDSDWDQIESQSGEAIDNQTKPDDLAYMIYTSGSTGKPKGVEVPHKTVVNLLNSMAQRPGLTPSDTVLALTTLSFDVSVPDLFLPLSVGAKVDVVTNEIATDGHLLKERIKSSGITFMEATPATWQLLITAGWEGSDQLKIICTGEAMPKGLPGQLLTRCGSLWNMYGPTEATVYATCYQVLTENGPILIGKPISNTQIYIVDPAMQPVPIGVAGELCIGGKGVTKGYRNRPELTADRFVDNPFSEDKNEKIYKTGDLARFKSDGNIECFNRLDNQVKIRGFRIELGEIEALLQQYESVAQSIVVVHEDKTGDKKLVAYVVFKPGLHSTSSDFRQFLRVHLPDYMVPAFYVDLEEIPKTPTGKVNRRALPSPYDHGELSGDDYLEPNTKQEKLIAEIWKELLGLEKVSLYDNFFNIGGHSLLSMQAISALENKTGQRIPARAMIVDSLAQIAESLDSIEPSTENKAEEREEPQIHNEKSETIGSRSIFARIKKGWFQS